MSPDRSSAQDGSTKILTKMPIERNHILVQQPQPQQQYLNNNNISNNNNLKHSILNLDTLPNCSNSNDLVTTTISTTFAINSTTAALTTTSPAITTSKIVVMNEMTENYPTNGNHPKQAEIGNILLLATEQMEPSDNEQNGDNEIDSGGGGTTKSSNKITTNGATDEELTPLHWLHDKNLLKGINLSCPKVRASPESARQMNGGSNGGAVSPNSDSRDDSGVSEDNTSSANSSSEHSGMYSTDASPKSINYQMDSYPINNSSSSSSNNKNIIVNNNQNQNSHLNNNNTNNSNSSNSNVSTIQPTIITPINGNLTQKQQQQQQPPMKQQKSPLIITGPQLQQQQQIQQQNGSTIIEYYQQHNSNLEESSYHQQQTYINNNNSSLINNNNNNNTYFNNKNMQISAISLTTSAPSNTQQGTLTSPISSTMNSSNSNSSSSHTPYTHFHKKYLREQTMKQQTDEAMKQQQDIQKPYQSHHHQQHQHLAPHQYLQQTQMQQSHINITPVHSVINRTDQPIYQENKELLNGYNNNNTLNINTNNYDRPEYDKVKNMDECGQTLFIIQDKYSSSSSTSSSSSSPSPKIKHPNNVPYDPLVHTSSKPPYSFSSLIFMAIEDSVQKALPVKEIYAWIVQHFPYFKTAPTGWKNSVRHNLSLNKCFQKVEKAANLGKGSLWMVEPQYRPNLIQALTRSPFHPCSTLEKHHYNKTNTNTPKQTAESPPPPMKQSNVVSSRLPNPEHFPFLARRLAAMEGEETTSRSSTPNGENYESHQYNGQTVANFYNGDCGQGTVIYPNNNSIIIDANLRSPEIVGRDIGADTLEDVNAATAMLALKHGPKIFAENFNHPPVIISSPSEDHTYSAGNGGKHENTNGADNQSNGTSSDAAYESSEESQVINERELEEQRRQAEGVDALLNLAGYNTNTTLLLKRPSSNGQYYYTTEISSPPPMNIIQQPHQQQQPPQIQQTSQTVYYDDDHPDDESYDSQPPPAKKAKTRVLRTKLKKKNWYR